MYCPTLSDLPSPPPGKTGWPWTEATSPPPSARPSDGVNWPKITVVTPSYNQGQYLEETIRSVLLQSYPNLEYIVVDDASTDGSVEILRKYDRYLSWWGVNERNSGQSASINRGFTHATGDIHAYLNSDDWYEPGALHTCAEAFREGTQWLVGQVRFFQEGMGYGHVPQLPGQRVSDWFVSCPISQPGCFWSAALHREVGPFRDDLHYFMDYEFWLRFRLMKQLKPHVINEPIALYRLHPESKTVAHALAFAAEAKPIRDHYRQYLTPVQRLGLRVAHRHRQARMRGSKALVLFRQAQFAGAVRELASAFSVWPLFVFDVGGMWLALKALCGQGGERVTASAIAPKWDH